MPCRLKNNKLLWLKRFCAAASLSVFPLFTYSDEVLSSKTTAGYDKNFFIQSQDGVFRLSFRGITQFRYAYNQQDDRSTDETQQGFELRRMRLFLLGNALSPKLKYTVAFDFNSSSGNAELFDGFFSYAVSENLTLTAGQFRLPYNREQLVGVTSQQGVDRSQLNYAFNLGAKGGRSQGLKLAYRNKRQHIATAFSDGINGVNTTFSAANPDWALTARYEHLVAGSWKQFKRYSAPRGSKLGVLLGIATHVEEGDTYQSTADFSLQNNGFNTSIYAYTRALREGNAEATGEVDQRGVGLQFGYFIKRDLEPYVRYENGDTDLAADEKLELITVGLNWFIKGNAVLLSSEFNYSKNQIPSLFARSKQGYIAGGSESDQYVFKTQFQLLF